MLKASSVRAEHEHKTWFLHVPAFKGYVEKAGHFWNVSLKIPAGSFVVDRIAGNNHV